MQLNHPSIDDERRRSARIVVIVYAAMALLFSMIALTLPVAGTRLGLAGQEANLMAGAFTTLAIINMLILEVWRRLFKRRL